MVLCCEGIIHYFNTHILTAWIPGWEVQGKVGRDTPGKVDIVLPLFLTQTDVLGPPVSNAGLYRLFGKDGQLLGGQWVVPRVQTLNLTCLDGKRWRQ